VVGRRSLGLSAGSNCQNRDYKGSNCPRKSLVLHEKPPNLRWTLYFLLMFLGRQGRQVTRGVITAQELQFGNSTLELRNHNGSL
jgi:hypothetical protein